MNFVQAVREYLGDYEILRSKLPCRLICPIEETKTFRDFGPVKSLGLVETRYLKPWVVPKTLDEIIVVLREPIEAWGSLSQQDAFALVSRGGFFGFHANLLTRKHQAAKSNKLRFRIKHHWFIDGDFSRS